MRRWFALVLVMCLFSPECQTDDSEDSVPTITGVSGIVGPVFVDSTEILYLESFPVQARLVVLGSLPTPCHGVRWEVENSGRGIDVTLWSEILLGQDCAAVLEPFEVSIPLGAFDSATSPVSLNGEPVGRLSIGSKPAHGEVTLVGAGWSFGMCGGYCQADLVLEDGAVVLTGAGWTSPDPLFLNRGTLTSHGRNRVAVAVAGLGNVPLEDVYGCPDCADGGAAYLVLVREEVVSRHNMDFGRPPDILAELHMLALSIIDALETCRSDQLVEVAEDCDPWEGF